MANFEHKGKTYQVKSRKNGKFTEVYVGLVNDDATDVKMFGMIKSRKDARAIWVIEANKELPFCVRLHRMGLLKAELIKHYLYWLVDKTYKIPDIKKRSTKEAEPEPASDWIVTKIGRAAFDQL